MPCPSRLPVFAEKPILLVVTAILAALVFNGCSNDSERVRSSCGIVINGERFNSVKDNAADRVVLTGFFDGNIVTLRKTNNNDLLTVVLHGLARIRNPNQLNAATEFVSQFLGSEGSFFSASDTCRVDSGTRNRLIPGQLFLLDGSNLSEELLIRGLAEIDTRNSCGSRLLEGCQTGLLLEGQG
jgi:hypothetical protein